MSYACEHAFARKFQLNFICGVAIESPPNRPPAINPHFRVSFALVYKWKYAVHSDEVEIRRPIERNKRKNEKFFLPRQRARFEAKKKWRAKLLIISLLPLNYWKRDFSPAVISRDYAAPRVHPVTFRYVAARNFGENWLSVRWAGQSLS